MTTLSACSLAEGDRIPALPRLPRDNGGPVFAEPWQAQAFALAVKLSEQGHFTWKEWAATLSDELAAAARRGEPDDGSRDYEHWLAALERLVTAKALASRTSLLARKEAWADAYRNTPHGKPVELRRSPSMAEGRWLLLGVAATAGAYWFTHAADGHTGPLVNPQIGFVASAGLGSLLGMRHALEPDHLVAVSTLMTGEHTSAKAAWLGACWGVGHTLTLLFAGALLLVMRTEMPAAATEAFELGLVLLLVGFGARAMYQGVWHVGATSRTHSHATRVGSTRGRASAAGCSRARCSWALSTVLREVAH